jgi:hypothetical protein
MRIKAPGKIAYRMIRSKAARFDTAAFSTEFLREGGFVRRILGRLWCFIRCRFQRHRVDDRNRPAATPDSDI